MRLRILLALVLVAAGCASGDKVDSSFDTHVSNPAYATDGPRVLFDEAHHNVHRASKSCRPFAKLIQSDGYRVSRGTKRTTPEELEPYSVYIIAAAEGTNERNDDPAFDDSECDAIRDWAFAGGSLLLITDHLSRGSGRRTPRRALRRANEQRRGRGLGAVRTRL
jgi:hypothetical protein